MYSQPGKQPSTKPHLPTLRLYLHCTFLLHCLSWRAREFYYTWERFDIPRRKQMASNMFDLPLPFRPVIALNIGSNGPTSVLWAYDLNPSMTICLINIAAGNASWSLHVNLHWLSESKARAFGGHWAGFQLRMRRFYSKWAEENGHNRTPPTSPSTPWQLSPRWL